VTVSPVDAVLFDWDGTLLDSRDALLGAWHEATEAVIGRRFPATHEEEHEVFTLPGAQIWPRLAGDLARQRELVERFQRAYAQTGKLVRPVPGVREAAAQLREAGIQIAVVTSKARRRFLLDARRAELDEVIDVSVCAEDAVATKPDPAPLVTALRALTVSASNALMVGDTEVDMLAGLAAGTAVAGVTWGEASERELRAAGAGIVVREPRELIAHVLGRSPARTGAPR
jgi:HAD superfamily hydrolase (TIGR01509 family)